MWGIMYNTCMPGTEGKLHQKIKNYHIVFRAFECGQRKRIDGAELYLLLPGSIFLTAQDSIIQDVIDHFK